MRHLPVENIVELIEVLNHFFALYSASVVDLILAIFLLQDTLPTSYLLPVCVCSQNTSLSPRVSYRIAQTESISDIFLRLMSYLDIDEILSEEERIPCIFTIDASGLGYLDSTNNFTDLPAHSKVELPLWLATTLTEKNMVDIELPKHYGSRIREDIMAGASAVPLREYSFYYFEVGWKISRLLRDTDLRKTLRIAFTGDRYKSLMARAMAK